MKVVLILTVLSAALFGFFLRISLLVEVTYKVTYIEVFGCMLRVIIIG